MITPALIKQVTERFTLETGEVDTVGMTQFFYDAGHNNGESFMVDQIFFLKED
jgi:hypothetical protein